VRPVVPAFSDGIVMYVRLHRAQFKRKKLQLGGSKEGGWGYTGPKPGAKMEIPVISETSRLWSRPGQTSQ
jgi:hypothetical protein